MLKKIYMYCSIECYIIPQLRMIPTKNLKPQLFGGLFCRKDILCSKNQTIKKKRTKITTFIIFYSFALRIQMSFLSLHFSTPKGLTNFFIFFYLVFSLLALRKKMFLHHHHLLLMF